MSVDRTRDLQIFSLTLSQLSYPRIYDNAGTERYIFLVVRTQALSYLFSSVCKFDTYTKNYATPKQVEPRTFHPEPNGTLPVRTTDMSRGTSSNRHRKEYPLVHEAR